MSGDNKQTPQTRKCIALKDKWKMCFKDLETATVSIQLMAQDEDWELPIGFSNVEALLNFTKAVLIQCWGQKPDADCTQETRESKR